MAFFQRNPEAEYTRQFAPAREDPSAEAWEDEEAYDDGFDELMDEEGEEELFSEEERQEEQRQKYRMLAGLGDFGATMLGAVVILVLVAFFIQMVKFVADDLAQNFSLWATKF